MLSACCPSLQIKSPLETPFPLKSSGELETPVPPSLPECEFAGYQIFPLQSVGRGVTASVFKASPISTVFKTSPISHPGFAPKMIVKITPISEETKSLIQEDNARWKRFAQRGLAPRLHAVTQLPLSDILTSCPALYSELQDRGHSLLGRTDLNEWDRAWIDADQFNLAFADYVEVGFDPYGGSSRKGKWGITDRECIQQASQELMRKLTQYDKSENVPRDVFSQGNIAFERTPPFADQPTNCKLSQHNPWRGWVLDVGNAPDVERDKLPLQEYIREFQNLMENYKQGLSIMDVKSDEWKTSRERLPDLTVVDMHNKEDLKVALNELFKGPGTPLAVCASGDQLRGLSYLFPLPRRYFLVQKDNPMESC